MLIIDKAYGQVSLETLRYRQEQVVPVGAKPTRVKFDQRISVR
jgi:hypothetical protein